MRYHISFLILAVVAFGGCVDRSRVSLPPTLSKAERLMTQFGEFSPANTVWSVSVSEHDRKVHLSRRTDFGSTGISPSSWRAKEGWCVFVEDARAWAYDGDRYLYMLEITANGTASFGPSGFPCRVPDEMLARLTPEAKKAMSRAD